MPRSRPRRNRKSPAIRDLCRETGLETSHLVYPLFLHEDGQDTALESLPGQTRWSLDGLEKEVARARQAGIWPRSDRGPRKRDPRTISAWP